MGETFPWLSLVSPHLGSGVVYVLIYVYVQIVGFFLFFFCLLVLLSVLGMRMRWSGNSLGCFNNFIHVGIFFFLYSIIEAVLLRGGGGAHLWSLGRGVF